MAGKYEDRMLLIINTLQNVSQNGNYMRTLITVLGFLTAFVAPGQVIEYRDISSNCRVKIVMTHTDYSDEEYHMDISNNTKGNIEINLTSNALKYFEEPVFFKFRDDNFIRIQEVFSGTGYDNFDNVYLIDEKCNFSKVEVIEVSRVEAKKLPDSVRVMKGEHRDFRDNSISFYFGLWRKDDPTCCPSIGWVTGTYEIVKEEENGKLKILMRQKDRLFKKDL